MIARRQKEKNNKYIDYLQLMLNAQNENVENQELNVGNDKSDEIFGQNDDIQYVQGKAQVNLTDDDVLANCYLFLLAGYETTYFLLTYLFYSLAMDEKCQQKLYEEVKAFDGNFDYESINQMTYLEACVAETLRMYNPFAITTRLAAEDYKLGLNLKPMKTILII